ncbi:glycosyltransferase [Sanguibacter sp. Z1732]|uniref:glycosyltransferase n=1 Tax=Sanguibacter sp. Z1732 TaxID=3435412 RepID=UPI003D9C857B
MFPTNGPPGVLPLYVVPGNSEPTVESAYEATLVAGSHVSFGSYFNAFPASVWRQHTAVDTVTLVLTLTGSGEITLYGSDASGRATELASRSWQNSGRTEAAHLSLDVALEGFNNGGWCWFELQPISTCTVSGSWVVDQDPLRTGNVTLGITTVNKPDYCIRTLQTLCASPTTRAVVDTVCVIDQGTDRVADQEPYKELAEAFGPQLRIISQENLGGSGGFARAASEALLSPRSNGVLFLDDDVRIEADSIFRAHRFASYCHEPTIVGGHMLDLRHPTVLHSWSEIVDQANFMWGPAVPEAERHDLAGGDLTQESWLHGYSHSSRTDYNGWWMCLIPTDVLDKAGLPAPFFIKWDDAEYGLRAMSHDVATVTMPGVALWHVSWLDKNDSVDWQAYFHARNRLITALLHAERPRGGFLLRDTGRLHLKLLLSMEYYAVSIRNRALVDVLNGPGTLHRSLSQSLPSLRAAAEGYIESTSRPTGRPPRKVDADDGVTQAGPSGLALARFTLRAVARQLLRPVPRRATRKPQQTLKHAEAHWSVLPWHDSVLVESRDGTTARWLRRDRRAFVSLWVQSLVLHRRIARRWPRLRQLYRQEFPEMTSPSVWRGTFAAGDVSPSASQSARE